MRSESAVGDSLMSDTATPGFAESAFRSWQPLLHRRDVLRCGTVSAAGSLMETSLQRQTERSEERASADSVILLWMGGGVTHIDSFDPKPEAPEQIRGTLSTISTSLPGVHFGQPMQKMSELADEICLVRSFSHDSNDHLLSQVYTLCGRKVTAAELFKHPNIGSVARHMLGDSNGLPGYIAVPGTTRPGPPPHNLFTGGWLGQKTAPFCTGGVPEQPDFTVGEKSPNPSALVADDPVPQDLQLLQGLSAERVHSRLHLRQAMDRARRELDGVSPERIQQFSQAAQLLTSHRIREAFELEGERETTRQQYGRTKIGNRCLMARRLVEAGAGFVMVDYGYDADYGNFWDNHNAASQNFPHVSELCLRGYHLAGMDRAFAALIEDLRDRGLLERTLVVFLTEFGRTPKINSGGGRDHWGMCGSVFFAGGGSQRGCVIGASDEQAAWPISTPWGPADIAATIYTALGIDPDSRIADQFNRPVPVLDHGRTIEGVLKG